MAVEIERKFLVRGEAWRSQVTRSDSMEQGYLARSSGDGEAYPGCSVRVRRSGALAHLNVKSREAGARRIEFEFPIDPDAASGLLEAFCRERIVKVRHHAFIAGHHWEIDEFGDPNAGLVIAEIELATVDAAVACPDWVGVELTHEPRFYNAALALRPFQQWPDRNHWLELMQAC